MAQDHGNGSNQSRNRITTFWWFLISVIIGMLFGVLTYPHWGMPGPYQAQISTGFWGLVIGIVSLVIRLFYQVARRSSASSGS